MKVAFNYIKEGNAYIIVIVVRNDFNLEYRDFFLLLKLKHEELHVTK